MKKAWKIFLGTILWLYACYQLYLAITTGTIVSRGADVSISNWSAPVFMLLFLLWLLAFLFPFYLALARFHKAVMSYGGNYNKNTIKRVILEPRK
jgi:hypothetical protein